MSDVVNYTTRCPNCKKTKKFKLDRAAYEKWQNGTFASYAFPKLSRDDHESLISGYCGKCWDELFPE